jgi:hypothetical protein
LCETLQHIGHKTCFATTIATSQFQSTLIPSVQCKDNAFLSSLGKEHYGAKQSWQTGKQIILVWWWVVGGWLVGGWRMVQIELIMETT